MDPSIPLVDKEPGDNPAHPDSKYSYDCLALSVSDTKEDAKDAIPEYSLTAVPCSIETPDYNSYMYVIVIRAVLHWIEWIKYFCFDVPSVQVRGQGADGHLPHVVPGQLARLHPHRPHHHPLRGALRHTLLLPDVVQQGL